MSASPVTVTLNPDNTNVDVQGKLYNIVATVYLDSIWEGIIVGDITVKNIYIEVYTSIPIIDSQGKQLTDEIYMTQPFKVSQIQNKTVELDGYFQGEYDPSLSRKIIAAAKVWQYSMVPYTEER